jgi:hypothetical protein
LLRNKSQKKIIEIMQKNDGVNHITARQKEEQDREGHTFVYKINFACLYQKAAVSQMRLFQNSLAGQSSSGQFSLAVIGGHRWHW